MPLSVIGAGFGRTGTMSLKLALEALGVGRCYHMVEVFPNPAAPDLWIQALDGRLGDWEKIFADYGATTDVPGCLFYKELAEAYPDAKVILTTRDPDKWFASTQATIFADSTHASLGDRKLLEMMQRLVMAMFDGRIHEHDHCIEIFQRHNAEVVRAIPPERLLVYDVAEGWEPLCRFLGKPVPDRPYPQANSREEFVNHHLPENVARLREGSATFG